MLISPFSGCYAFSHYSDTDRLWAPSMTTYRISIERLQQKLWLGCVFFHSFFRSSIVKRLKITCKPLKVSADLTKWSAFNLTNTENEPNNWIFFHYENEVEKNVAICQPRNRQSNDKCQFVTSNFTTFELHRIENGCHLAAVMRINVRLFTFDAYVNAFKLELCIALNDRQDKWFPYARIFK